VALNRGARLPHFAASARRQRPKDDAAMANQDLLLQALKSFAVAMGGSYDINEMAYELSFRVAEALGVAGAGVSIADAAGDLKFVTATNETIVKIEHAQEDGQEGPCVTAYLTQQAVAIPDIRDVQDWAAYTTAAEQLDLRAVVGFPLSYDGERLGALNIYHDQHRDWDEEDLDIIGVFANMATAYLVRVTELAESRQLAKQLQEALDSRVIIEQAKGILAAEYQISVDDAFQRLRRHSQDNNLKLTEVCNAVVNMKLRFPAE
jgi:GAF domain-containing protein